MSQVSTRHMRRRELSALLTLTVMGPEQPGTKSSGIVTPVHVRPTGQVPAVQTVPHVVCAAARGALMSASESERAAAMFRAKRMVDSISRLYVVETGIDCGE